MLNIIDRYLIGLLPWLRRQPARRQQRTCANCRQRILRNHSWTTYHGRIVHRNCAEPVKRHVEKITLPTCPQCNAPLVDGKCSAQCTKKGGQ
jgi:hypothetical protein